MDPKELARLITGIIERVEQFIPHYMENEEDRKKAAGGIAICILDQDGRVYGKMFGTDKIMMRERYRVAWMKASQVWITGIKTGSSKGWSSTKKLTRENLVSKGLTTFDGKAGSQLH